MSCQTARCMPCACLLLNLVLAGNTVMGADRVGPNPSTGLSAAVIAGSALVHTEQFLPVSVTESDVTRKQLENVMEQLQTALTAADAGDLVKLNFCVASDAVAAEIRQALPEIFPAGNQPAAAFVVSTLPVAGARVAVDGVAEIKSAAAASLAEVQHTRGAARMPAGVRIHVSGQAEQSESLSDATTKTLESLRKTLIFLGRTDRDIVQLKAFLQPMEQAAVVSSAVQEFYRGLPVPPLVLVEWKSSRTTPVEIELVAWGGSPAPGAPSLEFLTPPGMTTPTIYCRVCRVNAPKSIYISGLYPEAGPAATAGLSTGDAEVKTVFASLGRILQETGSDFRHLVKATYYVATDESSASLNKLRPEYYDPQRPPAASKAMVSSTGRPGTGLTIDMIAVPATDN